MGFEICPSTPLHSSLVDLLGSPSEGVALKGSKKSSESEGEVEFCSMDFLGVPFLPSLVRRGVYEYGIAQQWVYYLGYLLINVKYSTT